MRFRTFRLKTHSGSDTAAPPSTRGKCPDRAGPNVAPTNFAPFISTHKAAANRAASSRLALSQDELRFTDGQLLSGSG